MLARSCARSLWVEATDSEELEDLEGRIAAERLRLREAEQHLRHLEDDLQAAKVHRAQQAGIHACHSSSC